MTLCHMRVILYSRNVETVNNFLSSNDSKRQAHQTSDPPNSPGHKCYDYQTPNVEDFGAREGNPYIPPDML